MQQKDFRGAIDNYTQALTLERAPETLTLRGWAYLTFDAPALALPDFNEAITMPAQPSHEVEGVRRGGARRIARRRRARCARRAAPAALHKDRAAPRPSS